MNSLECRIAENRQVAEAVFLICLEAPEIALRARPGQFVMLRVGRGWEPLLRRPFSICGVRDTTHILVLYQVVGRGTELLAGRRPGQTLPVLGPLGRGFRLPPGTQRAILVGGGMGIAPLLFLARTLRQPPAVFLCGYAAASRVIPGWLFDPGRRPRVVTEDGSAGSAGLVTDHLAAEMAAYRPGRAEIYACGPRAMLREVIRLAEKAGLPCQVSLEAVMACGVGACQGCVVRAGTGTGPAFYRVCRDGPVFAANLLDREEL